MKHFLLAAMLAATALPSTAAERFYGVSVEYPAMSVTFVPQPLMGEGNSLPFVQAALNGGSPERFGVFFDEMTPSSPWLDILDARGRVAAVLSVNDALGNGLLRRQRALPKDASSRWRRVETIYNVRVGTKDVQVVVRAMSVEDDGGDHVLVVTFGLRSETKVEAALRARLPVLGNVTAGTSGFVVSSRSGNAALGAQVLPHETAVRLERKMVVLTSKQVTITPQREGVMFWLVLKGFPTSVSASPAELKKQVIRMINGTQSRSGQASIVAVNVPEKERSLEGDTASYMMVCANIGTAVAEDVVVERPLPSGARYIEGTSEVSGVELSMQRGVSGGAELLRVRVTGPLNPGEERIIAYRVLPSGAAP